MKNVIVHLVVAAIGAAAACQEDAEQRHVLHQLGSSH
jgi:hypothetical protein